MTSFRSIFQEFIDEKDRLKVVFVGSCSAGKPSAAPKMLVEIKKPNRVYYLDYKYTNTYANIRKNKRASIAFMNERKFRGFRLSGICRPLTRGSEWRAVRDKWEKRLNAYHAGRIVERLRGEETPRTAESALPSDFVIVRFSAKEASVVEPDRVLRRRAGGGR